MEIPRDFKEFLTLFNAHGVEYIVIGGFALAYHGAPRFTGDLDIFINPTPENGSNVIMSLQIFGIPEVNLDPQDFIDPDKLFRVGNFPVRVEIFTSISGVSWEDADAGKVRGMIDDVPVSIIGYQEFIKNKRASGRTKDLLDLDALGEKI